MDIEYPNLSAAIVDALIRKPDWWTPKREQSVYTPTLPGITYDRSQHRLRAQVFRHIDGRKRCWTIGTATPTPENERMLYERWKVRVIEIDQELGR